VRTPDDLDAAFRQSLIDAAIIDLAGAGDDTWRAASFAREFPSVPFFGLTALRATEGPALAQCAAFDFADALGVTREHLSRTFAADGAPNLKRVIDLVRLIAAAELAKNPGYDVRDVASVLDFASSSHLSSTAQRIVGTKPASLSRLRAVDLVDRFTKGHGRSRG
jgi:AraC-like DNA-binding protein